MDLLPWYIITPVHLGEQCYTFPLLLEIAQMFHAYWEAHRWPGCNWMVFHKVNTCMSPASKSRNNSCKCSKVCDFVIATKSWASPLPPNPHASLLAVNTLTSWCCLCCTLTLCGFHASPLFCWRVGLAPLSWAFWLLVGQRADVAFSAAKQGPPAPVYLLPLPTGQSFCATLRPPGAAPSPPGVCLLLTPGRPQLLWLIATVLVSCSCCMEVSQIGWL